MFQTTKLTGGIVPNATRIDSDCWLDGDDDHLIVEFWHMPGSILRTVYNRRTTVSRSEFIPVDSWEFSQLMQRATATFYDI